MIDRWLERLRRTGRATIACAVLFAVTPAPSDAGSFFKQDAGRPAAGPLPEYCQMGECTLVTVEASDPVLFAESGVLFRVLSQNWESKVDVGRRRRGADSVGFVFCSKRMPAVVDGSGKRFMVTFLAPDDAGSYGHFNELSMALYFVVCHARAFKGDLMEAGPAFARSLGYAVTTRDDQPIITEPSEILKFVK